MIGTRAAFHDYGEATPDGFRVGRTVNPFTGKPNPLFFPADAGLLAAAEAVAADLKRGPRSGPGRAGAAGGRGGDRDGGRVRGLAGEAGRAADGVQGRRDRDGRCGGGPDLLAAAGAVPDPPTLSDDAGARAPEYERHFEKAAAENSALPRQGFGRAARSEMSSPPLARAAQSDWASGGSLNEAYSSNGGMIRLSILQRPNPTRQDCCVVRFNPTSKLGFSHSTNPVSLLP